MKTKIIKIKGDWNEVLNDCRSTVGKSPLAKEPSTEFKKRILIAEHSPIRDIIVKWSWIDIKSWIATHFSRGKYEKFIKTQRDDRTGIPRDDLPQGSPVDMTMELNAQHLIDTARKRLCRQSHPETRAYMEDVKRTLHNVEPEIADVMVPSCIYRGCACPEMTNCGFIDAFIKRHGVIAPIQERYDAYNKEFYGDLTNGDN